MAENSERADIVWNKNKRGLLLSLMKDCFEANMYEILEKGKYDSMEELDGILDTELRKYYAEVDTVKSFYEPKCS